MCTWDVPHQALLLQENSSCSCSCCSRKEEEKKRKRSRRRRGRRRPGYRACGKEPCLGLAGMFGGQVVVVVVK
jgi:hypothetical protein